MTDQELCQGLCWCRRWSWSCLLWWPCRAPPPPGRVSVPSRSDHSQYLKNSHTWHVSKTCHKRCPLHSQKSCGQWLILKYLCWWLKIKNFSLERENMQVPALCNVHHSSHSLMSSSPPKFPTVDCFSTSYDLLVELRHLSGRLLHSQPDQGLLLSGVTRDGCPTSHVS